jgi:hypothetical protein
VSSNLQGVLTWQVESAVRVVLIVLTFRSLPLVATISAAETCTAMVRTAIVLAYTLVGVLALQYAHYDVIEMTLGYVYLLSAAVAYFHLSKHVNGRVLLFSASTILFLLVPACAHRELRTIALVLGWELMLSSYSYAASARGPRVFSEFISFLFLNPSLVYGHRGKVEGPIGISAWGLWRILQGAGLMMVGQMLSLVTMYSRSLALNTLQQVLVGFAAFAQFYGVQAGLASIQIGLCRQAGIRAPERYRRPYVASSPKDFWSRWNTYVGNWIRLYVFQPTMKYARRRFGMTGRPAFVFSILVSFAATGLLHASYQMLSMHQIRYWTAVWFTLNGLLIVVWEFASQASIPYISSRTWRTLYGRALVVFFAAAMASAVE